MDTGYYELPKDYSTRPHSSFIDTATYIIQRWGGSAIWHRHMHDIYDAQTSGMGPFEFANKILDKYRNSIDEKGNKR